MSETRAANGYKLTMLPVNWSPLITTYTSMRLVIMSVAAAHRSIPFFRERTVTNNARSKNHSIDRPLRDALKPNSDRVPSKDGPPADLYLCSFNWNQNRIADQLQVNRNDLYHWQIITHPSSRGEFIASRHCNE